MADGMTSTGMKGWGALGEILAGQLGEPDTYQDTLKGAYTTEKALQEARRARSQALIDAARLESRGAFTPETMARFATGDTAAQAEVMAGALGSATTPNLRNLGDYSRAHYGDFVNLANEAAVLGDIPTANKFNAMSKGDEYQPVRELGNAFVGDGVALGDLVAIPTPESLSRIEKNETQGRATMVRAERPPGSRTATVKPMSTSQMEAEELRLAREAVQAGADPAAVADAMRARGFANLAAKIHK